MEIVFLTKNSSQIREIETFVQQWNEGQEWFDVKSSGSTGTPKVIRLHRNAMETSARATLHFLKIEKNSSLLLGLSPQTIGGKMMIVRALVGNHRLFVSEPQIEELHKIDLPIDFAALVPLQVSGLLERKSPLLDQIHNLIIGGAAISEDLEKALVDYPMEAYQTFGMTETISHFALRKLNSGKPYSCLPGVRISQDQDGAMIVNYPALGIIDLQTTDLIDLIDEQHFYWLGRKDFVINSGGIKLHPEIIEQKLASVLSGNYFSIGVPDEILGQKHVLCLESDSPEMNREMLSRVLGKYELPKEIWSYTTFHYTTSGKIDRIRTINNSPDVARSLL